MLKERLRNFENPETTKGLTRSEKKTFLKKLKETRKLLKKKTWSNIIVWSALGLSILNVFLIIFLNKEEAIGSLSTSFLVLMLVVIPWMIYDIKLWQKLETHLEQLESLSYGTFAGNETTKFPAFMHHLRENHRTTLLLNDGGVRLSVLNGTYLAEICMEYSETGDGKFVYLESIWLFTFLEEEMRKGKRLPVEVLLGLLRRIPKNYTGLCERGTLKYYA